MDELIAKANLGGAVSFLALDAATGAILASREADLPFAPASTLKSVTALYAQSVLGAEHRFATRVIRAGDLLILAGGGDPELDSDGLAELAKAAAEAEKAAGRPAPARFAVWGGALPQIAEISPGQAAHLTYNPTISGMILNFNRVHLGWRRGESGYALTLEARGRKHSPRAYTIAAGVADRAQPLFTYDGAGAKESWTIARSAMGKAGAAGCRSAAPNYTRAILSRRSAARKASFCPRPR
ncbi:D-alanyl-D-alanine carboxypeptidase [Paracoccus cavernae]|uniref:D-alanyl-D-alanine carboxypeptidase n=1 Tax=Paracoccus cavernae TaxID=1571207 RepID=UPI003630B2D7